jgi:hypothetical protein
VHGGAKNMNNPAMAAFWAALAGTEALLNAPVKMLGHSITSTGAGRATATLSHVSCLSTLYARRQQLQDALTVVEAGLAKLQPSDRCDHAFSTTSPSSGGSTGAGSSSSSMAALPHFYDVLLLRLEAQLLLALSDANRAVAVLGTAIRRLAHARKGLEARPSLAGGVAAELLREQEAQVRKPQFIIQCCVYITLGAVWIDTRQVCRSASSWLGLEALPTAVCSH